MPSFSLNTKFFNSTLYSRLISLWFTDLPLPSSSPSFDQITRWFGAGDSAEAKSAFDSQCVSTALPALESISADNYPLPPFTDAERDRVNYSTIAEPFVHQFTNSGDTKKEGKNEEAALGLMLLLDQMPRNAFRQRQNTIYQHYDRISRAVAYSIYSRGLDNCSKFRNSPPWRVWFYMPLMHSEAVNDHKLWDEKTADIKKLLTKRADKEGLAYTKTVDEFEAKHRDLLERFGRYPHRNQFMGRDDTAEEKRYLEEGGDRFGT